MTQVQSNVVGSAEAAARALLEADELDAAIDALQSYDDPSGVREALLGAAYFRKEDYREAAEYLRRAQACGQDSPELSGLLSRALANAAADVQRPVPAPVTFDREQLLSGPRPGTASAERLPEPAAGSALRFVLRAVGKLAGHKLGVGLQL
ncbi:MAG TPA: hypothetical protein VJR89_41705, partial [Polyangiales bacterium]|nr:hypothetical protein [Polyangiales bacterium]